MKTWPDVIYFASDGDFPDDDAVLREVRKQYAISHVMIDRCVAGDRADNQERMYQIAKLTGGRCFDLGRPRQPARRSSTILEPAATQTKTNRPPSLIPAGCELAARNREHESEVRNLWRALNPTRVDCDL